MLSTIPFDLTKVKKENIDMEVLRVAIIAELDAINLYEQLAGLATNKDLKPVLRDVIKEEKTHVGEFQDLLLMLDKEQEEELENGREEVQELIR